ncbi:MAG TPA: phosphoglucosamine mutase [Firmicutes bacterium]|mgnify:FL=1|jgi:phosphoglucosamine mutase|nr:phosphoglucosamine mutase [Bacillota bacterium]
MARLFGTDGVRGVANSELTAELALNLGRSAAGVFAENSSDSATPGKPRFVIGKDTRISGDMLESALAAGLMSAGVDVIRIGILPTPAVAYLIRHLNADGGAMISASHNPVPDNGIKFFDADGFKLTDAVEDEIEARIARHEFSVPVGTAVGKSTDFGDAWRDYAIYLSSIVTAGLEGIKVVVDTAFGASWQVAPEVLAKLGAEVCAINNQADGAFINVNCGSTNPQQLGDEVLNRGASVGVAYDGDADRAILVDENGVIVNGDQILAICGLDMLKKGTLPGKTVAATVYSNLGLIEAFRKRGGEVVVTPNGDRYVLEAMRQKGLALGGEQSGHIIFLQHNTTGDGVLASLKVLGIMAETGIPLSLLAKQMEAYPQVNRGVRVARKGDLESSQAIRQVVKHAEERLGNRGRIFVRASGTEPLVRVMVEAPEADLIETLAQEVCAVIEKELG